MRFTIDFRLVLSLILLVGVTESRAASFTWDGSGSGSNTDLWGKKQNWGNQGPPGLNDIANFDTVVSGKSITPLVNINSSISSIVFASTATSFTFGGSSVLTVGSGGIVNNASALQTFNTALALGALQTWSGNGSMDVAGIVSGSGALTKSGNGTVNLTGANTFSSGLTVGGGRVLVNNTTGSGTGTGDVLVNSGLFGGAGKITGGVTLNSGAHLSAGANGGSSIGTVATGNQTWNSGANVDVDISDATGTAGTSWDSTTITGALALNGTPLNKIAINLNGLSLANFNANDNYQWQFVQTTGGISGFDANAFDVTATGFGPLLGSSQFLISLVDGGNGLAITYVPEPSTMALGILGATLFAGGYIRRKK